MGRHGISWGRGARIQAVAPSAIPPSGDPSLRSVRNVTGYYIEATDGDLGHVEDFIVDTSAWAIRYMIIDTRNWWPGKKVLVSPEWINRVSWPESRVYVDMSKDAISARRNTIPTGRSRVTTRHASSGITGAGRIGTSESPWRRRGRGGELMTVAEYKCEKCGHTSANPGSCCGDPHETGRVAAKGGEGSGARRLRSRLADGRNRQGIGIAVTPSHGHAGGMSRSSAASVRLVPAAGPLRIVVLAFPDSQNARRLA